MATQNNLHIRMNRTRTAGLMQWSVSVAGSKRIALMCTASKPQH